MAAYGGRLPVLPSGLQYLGTQKKRNGGDTGTLSAAEMECLARHVHVVGEAAVCLRLIRSSAGGPYHVMAQKTDEHESVTPS